MRAANKSLGERLVDMRLRLAAASTFCVLGPRARRRITAGNHPISAAEARGLPMRKRPVAVMLLTGDTPAPSAIGPMAALVRV
jgi:hypothetical protein